jgi:hypothetical protein
MKLDARIEVSFDIHMHMDMLWAVAHTEEWNFFRRLWRDGTSDRISGFQVAP